MDTSPGPRMWAAINAPPMFPSLVFEGFGFGRTSVWLVLQGVYWISTRGCGLSPLEVATTQPLRQFMDWTLGGHNHATSMELGAFVTYSFVRV